MTLIFATNNTHKRTEAESILGAEVKLVGPAEVGITEDIPETQPTIEGNALQKARYIWERCRQNCFADDTGLEVEALGGEPGVRSARYAGEGHNFEANIDLLLHNLEGAENRKARFRTVIALIFNGNEYTFEGIIEGRIIDRRQGSGGFGYDSVFIPDGYSKTFAELPAQVKNTISHRALALEKMNRWLIQTI